MVQDKKPDPSAIREIPQDIQAEQSVLGAMLISREAVSEVAEMLVPQDFYRQSNRVIFNAMMTLYSRNDAVDLVTVTNELQKEGKLGDAEGVAYLTLLGNMVPTAANVKYHAKIVEEKSTLRQLVDGGTEIARMGYDGSEDVPVILDRAERCILQISNRKGGRDFEPISTIVGNTINRISELAGNTSGITGLKTGFVDFDRLTAGLHPSDFIILAARPSMGKTALALNIAQNVAIRGNGDGEPKKVAFFSLEMSREQLVQRMLCSEAEVDAQKLRIGQLSAEEWNKLWQAADRLGSAKIFIDDTPGLRIMEMRSKARRLKAQEGLDMIVVDYLQLMQGSATKANQDNRQQEVSEISRGLKALARELDVPVLALSQLSRGVESRQVKKPMLSDLRESGSLEQDADIVCFLYRDDYYKAEDEEPTHITELIVAKHRNGPVGHINLFFREQFTKFADLARRES